MESLPKQHIDSSLAPADRKKVYEQLTKLCLARHLGIDSEEELAKRAEFPSAEVMRISLENWGLSSLLPLQEKPQSSAPSTPKSVPKRKRSQDAGEAEKLPPAANAARLFEMAFDRFKSDLDLTNHLVEFLGEDDRFYSYGVYPPKTTSWPREAFSPQEWEEECAKRGKDPATTEELSFTVDRSGARGASRYPDRWLTGLIAQYLLQAGDWRGVELLVEKLHPETRPVDWEGIEKHLIGDRNDGFLVRARQLAALVRGGKVERGRIDPISMSEHGAALDVRSAREQGMAEDEISRTVQEFHGLDEEELEEARENPPPIP